MKKTCLSIDCPERTGGECTATPQEDEELSALIHQSGVNGDYEVEQLKKLLKARDEQREREAFQRGQRVGQYQAADRLYSYVTSIYLFKDDEEPKMQAHATSNAAGLLKDCEKYLNHNRKVYVEYVATLTRPQKGNSHE